MPGGGGVSRSAARAGQVKVSTWQPVNKGDSRGEGWGGQTLLTGGAAKVPFTVVSPRLLGDKHTVMDGLVHKVGEEIQARYLLTYIPVTWNHDCFLSFSSEAGA